MRRHPRLRHLTLAGLVICLFWLAAQLASGIPPLHVLATSVDGLVLADYRQDPLQSLSTAPLSGRIYSDAYRDALNAPSGISWVWFGTANPERQVTAAAPSPSGSVAAGGPTAAPIAPANASATATPTATPAPTPTPMPSATSSPSPTAAPTPTPTPTPTATPMPTPTPTNTGTVSGRVIDWNTNGGIAGATLTLSPGGPTTVTDASGNFTRAVPAGNYTLTVSASGYPPQSQTITVTAGGRAGGNIWLVPSAQAGTVQGKVTDSATGLPIAGATLYINQPGFTVYTDANGNYSFSDLAAGNKVVSASAPSHSSSNSRCSVTAGQVTILDIKLIHT